MQPRKRKEIIKRTQTLSLATAMLVTSLNFPALSVRAEDNEQTTTEIEHVIDETEQTEQPAKIEQEEQEEQPTNDIEQTVEEEVQEEQEQQAASESEIALEEANEDLANVPVTLSEDEVTVTITFDANGGQFSDGSQQKVITKTVSPYTIDYADLDLSETPTGPDGKTWTFINWNSTGDDYGTDYETIKRQIFSGNTDITVYAHWSKTQAKKVPRTYVYTRGVGDNYTYSCNDTITLDDEGNLINWGEPRGLDRLDLSTKTKNELGVMYSMRTGSDVYYSDAQLTKPLTDADKYIETVYVDCRYDVYMYTLDISGNRTGSYQFLSGDDTPVPDEPTAPEGYMFVGWYERTDRYTGDTSDIDAYISFVNDNLSPYDFSKKTSSRSVLLYPQFAEYNKVTYTLYNDGSTFPDGTTASKTFTYNTFIQGVNNTVREADIKYSDMTEVIPVREGYIFCGWTSTQGSGLGDVTTDDSKYTNGTTTSVTSHTGTDFWMNYNNNADKNIMEIYDSVTVYPVWTKAITFDACGGKFSNNLSTAYSTHDMLYDTYTSANGDRQQTLWQNKCPVPTRDGYQFVGWSNTQPASNTDFTNTYRLNEQFSGLSAVTINDLYALVSNNKATAAKVTNDDGAKVYAVWVPTYTKVIYHMDDMELDGTLKDNGIDGVTDYIDSSDSNDIKLIQYVPWYTDMNYQYSFKKDGRTVSNKWYKSRSFNVSEDYLGDSIPKQKEDIEVYTRQYVAIHFNHNYSDIVSDETFELNESVSSPIGADSKRFYASILNEETGVYEDYYYSFGGWYTNAECSGSAVDFSNLKATEETTYYAKWVEPKITHTVTFVEGYDGSTVDTKTVERNKTVKAPTYAGNKSYMNMAECIMIGWSETGSENNLFDFSTPITGNKTLYAVYVDAVTIEFIDSYDGQTVDTKRIAKNDLVPKPSFRGNDPDKKFVGWSETGSADDLFDFSTGISDSITLISVYVESDTPVKKIYTVRFDSNGGSAVDEQEVESGERATKPANPTREGYTFDCWTVGLLEFNFNNAITQDITLVARWTKNTEPSQPEQPDPAPVEPTEPEKPDPTPVEPEQPAVKHTVRFIDWDGRIVAIQLVEDGSNAVAPASPVREGYTFTGWDKSLDNVTADMEVRAQYSKNETEKPITTEPEKPQPEPEQPTPEPTQPEPGQPEPEQPKPETPVEPETSAPTEPTQPEDEEEIIPIIEDEPESEEEPTDSEEGEPVEDNIIPEIVVNEVTPEDDPAPIYVGDNNSDKETNATALGRFVEAMKVVAVTAVISLAALLGLLGLLIIILLWMKRVKVLNDKNTDEYNEEKFEVVYRTSVKSEGNLISELQKQENRVWTITIPDEIINERVTDKFRIELKKHFCKRYNGEQLIIKLGESEDARQIGKTIDEKENTVEFTFTE